MSQERETTANTRSSAVEESARGLDAMAECASILPGYQSIAQRAAATMRAMVKERAAMRAALSDLCAWGRQCPTTAAEREAHSLAAGPAFAKARKALRHGR